MWQRSALIFLSVLLVRSLSSTQKEVKRLSMCTNNETMFVDITTIRAEGRSSCNCQIEPAQDPVYRVGYTHTPGVGSHKFYTQAKTWNDARKACNDEGAHLAIINSKAEEAILVDLLKKSKDLVKDSLHEEEALLGIHDLYKEGEWTTIFGESIYNTGYYHWSPTYWGGQPDNFDGRQNCGALIDQGGMDDVFCDSKFAYFCELPITCQRL